MRDRLFRGGGEGRRERTVKALYAGIKGLPTRAEIRQVRIPAWIKRSILWQRSEDDAYRGPAGELNRILSEKEDKEQLKEIDTYAQLTVDHIVPIVDHSQDTDGQKEETFSGKQRREAGRFHAVCHRYCESERRHL